MLAVALRKPSCNDLRRMEIQNPHVKGLPINR
jgi:hypothetical protein